MAALSQGDGSGYSIAMASIKPINAPGGPPPEPSSARPAKATDRRLRLEDILKLMVADGLVLSADADKLARSRTQRFEHPLELIADQKWRSISTPRKALTLGCAAPRPNSIS